MTWHSIIQYCKYRLKAKTRHGIHSPFVYAFIEQCLMAHSNDTLLQRIKEYFAGHRIIALNTQQYEQCVDSITKAEGHTVLVVHNIHETETTTENWDKLSHQQQVRLSIDLFHIGLMFFNEDFKTQQHFVLKYPL